MIAPAESQRTFSRSPTPPDDEWHTAVVPASSSSGTERWSNDEDPHRSIGDYPIVAITIAVACGVFVGWFVKRRG
jgi:hypothetical protein